MIHSLACFVWTGSTQVATAISPYEEMVNSLYQVRFVKRLGEGYSSQQFEPRLIGANTLKAPPSAYGQRYYGYGHGHGHGQGHGYGLILEPLLRPRMNYMGVEQLQSCEVGLQSSSLSYMFGADPWTKPARSRLRNTWIQPTFQIDQAGGPRTKGARDPNAAGKWERR